MEKTPPPARGGGGSASGQFDGEEMVDGEQDDQQRYSEAEAETDQLLLDRQQRLDCRGVDFIAKIGLRHEIFPFVQLTKGGLKPLKNSHEINRPTQITKPNRLTK